MFRVGRSARLLIVGQAPGRRVHETGIPWNDPSGDVLRAWLGARARGVLRHLAHRHRADRPVLPGHRGRRRPAAAAASARRSGSRASAPRCRRSASRCWSAAMPRRTIWARGESARWPTRCAPSATTCPSSSRCRIRAGATSCWLKKQSLVRKRGHPRAAPARESCYARIIARPHEAARLARQPVHAQGARRARREEDRLRAAARRRRSRSTTRSTRTIRWARSRRWCSTTARALYDSRVIVEFLDGVSPISRLIPEDRATASRCAAGRRSPTACSTRACWCATSRCATRRSKARPGATSSSRACTAAWRRWPTSSASALVPRRALLARRHRAGLLPRLARLPQARRRRLARRIPGARAALREADGAARVRRHAIPAARRTPS